MNSRHIAAAIVARSLIDLDKPDWLANHAVFAMLIVMILGGLVFFWRAFTRDDLVIDLDAFRDRNFALGSLFSFVLGGGLYGLTYFHPLFPGRTRGYDSLMIRQTMFVSGLAMFFAAPLAGVLSRKWYGWSHNMRPSCLLSTS